MLEDKLFLCLKKDFIHLWKKILGFYKNRSPISWKKKKKEEMLEKNKGLAKRHWLYSLIKLIPWYQRVML